MLFAGFRISAFDNSGKGQRATSYFSQSFPNGKLNVEKNEFEFISDGKLNLKISLRAEFEIV